MLNPVVSFWFFGLLTCFISGCGESKPKAEPLVVILKGLGSESSEADRNRAVQEIRSLHTNLLPAIVSEIEAIGRSEPDRNNTDLGERLRRLSSLFYYLGPMLEPIRDRLAENVAEDRNYASAIDAFAAMRETGIPYLMLALTNRSENIRYHGINAVLDLGASRSRFVGPLLPQVTTMLDDEDPAVRIRAAQAFSFLCRDLDSGVSKLLDMASDDLDVSVRKGCVSTVESLVVSRPIDAHLKSQIVERFGRIAADDESENVRKTARSALSKLAE